MHTHIMYVYMCGLGVLVRSAARLHSWGEDGARRRPRWLLLNRSASREIHRALTITDYRTSYVSRPSVGRSARA